MKLLLEILDRIFVDIVVIVIGLILDRILSKKDFYLKLNEMKVFIKKRIFKLDRLSNKNLF